jgi:hypothetical protein
MQERKPTCFDCITTKIYRGTAGDYYSPPEPDEAECLNEDVDDKLFEENDYNEDDLPELCGQFQPKMIKKCGNKDCNKEMNVPEWSWKLWAATMWNNIPVCSKQCKQKVEDEDELEEMRAEGYSTGTIEGKKK